MKISVIGAGYVGSNIALFLAEDNLGEEIVVVDIVEGLAKGKMLDLAQASSLRGYQAKISGSENFEEISNSDIVVITAGLPRKPGMSRLDLLKINEKIVKEVSEKIKNYCNQPIVIVVTNPLDIMCYVAKNVTNYPSSRVFGMAGVLDSARMNYFISQKLKTLPSSVQTLVLGGHGDEMVPLTCASNVSGIPLTQLLKDDEIREIIEKTKYGGAEIVSYLKTGSAFFSPAASVVDMIRAIIKDEKRIIAASVCLQGEYGEKDIYCGVPVVLGKGGVKKIIELKLTDYEQELFKKSAHVVRETIKNLTL